jgi:hypothetical protein
VAGRALGPRAPVVTGHPAPIRLVDGLCRRSRKRSRSRTRLPAVQLRRDSGRDGPRPATFYKSQHGMMRRRWAGSVVDGGQSVGCETALARRMVAYPHCRACGATGVERLRGRAHPGTTTRVDR